MCQPQIVSQKDFTPEIRSFVVNTFLFGEDDPELTDDASLLELGIVDSTGILELVAFVESEFGVQVSDGEMTAENLDSIRRISDYVARKHASAQR